MRIHADPNQDPQHWFFPSSFKTEKPKNLTIEYKYTGSRVFGNAVHAAGVGKETGELAVGTIPLRQ